MTNWKYIATAIFVLIGGTLSFGYWSMNQFNQTFDNLSASYIDLANTYSAYQASDRIDAELASTSLDIYGDVATSTATSTDSELYSVSSVSELSFTFPESDSLVYVGCTYPISWEPSLSISLLETILVDAGSRDTIEPVESGLAKENKLEPNSEGLDWKVGPVWPGKYYIKMSDMDDGVLRSGVFTISAMPQGISTDEKEKICEESGN